MNSRCSICDGFVQPNCTASKSFAIDNEVGTLTVHDVPVLRCVECLHEYYAAETMEYLEHIRGNWSNMPHRVIYEVTFPKKKDAIG